MWLYDNREVTEQDTEGFIAFVYLITNLETNKKYIGKKLLKKTRSKTIKGKTRKKKIISESDWRDYYGSNENLKKDVELLGPKKFKREILEFCKSRGTANYLEAKFQMECAVLEYPDEYYNEQIRVRVHRSHLKLD
jgi:hypothetical protein